MRLDGVPGDSDQVWVLWMLLVAGASVVHRDREVMYAITKKELGGCWFVLRNRDLETSIVNKG